MNADPVVMRHFPSPLTAEQSNGFADRIEEAFARDGFGLYAVEVPGVMPFAGFIGLSVPRFESFFTPCVEIGWRLAAEAHGKGYATEGARAVLDYAFNELGMKEIVSFTSPLNVPSIHVMEKIGMTHDPSETFMHPSVPDGHPLQVHVLYRIRKLE